MFSKITLILLLCCTVVFAGPVDNSEPQRETRSIISKFAKWLHKADDALASLYERVTSPFKKILDTVIQTGEGVVDYGREKVNQLLETYYELKYKSEQSINNVKNKFLVKVINELQNVIDTLAQETDGETFEKLKEKTQEIAQSGKDALEKLQQQLQEAINVEKQKLEQNLNKWENEANSIVKNRH